MLSTLIKKPPCIADTAARSLPELDKLVMTG